MRGPRDLDPAQNGGEEGTASRFPKPIFYPRYRLTNDAIVPNITNFISGNIVHWDSPDAADEYTRAINPDLSIINQTLCLMVDMQADEADVGFGLLADDLEGISPERAVLFGARLPEYFFKRSLAMNAHNMISIRRGVDDGLALPQAIRYQAAIEDSIRAEEEVVSELQPDNVASFIKYADFFETEIEITKVSLERLNNKTYMDKRLRAHDTETLELMAKVQNSVHPAETIWSNGLLNVYYEAWDRVMHDWNWQQIADAVGALTTIQHGELIDEVGALIEYNLTNLEHQSPQEYAIAPPDISPEGIVMLLQHNGLVPTASTYSRLIPELHTHMDKSAHAGPAFAEHFPTPAILLLRSLAGLQEPERFEKLVQDVHQLVSENRPVGPRWAVTLNAISSIEQFRELADELTAQASYLSEDVRNILIDKKAGSVWLTEDGKLVLYRPKRVDACLIYKNAVEEKSAVGLDGLNDTGSTETGEEGSSPESIPIENEVPVLRFFGEVGVVQTDAAHSILEQLTHDAVFPRDFNEMDKQNISYQRQRVSQEEKRIADELPVAEAPFYYLLHEEDHHFKEAAAMGIQGVHVRGPEAFLILDKSKLTGVTDAQRIAIAAQINQDGSVAIPGMESEEAEEFMEISDAGVFLKNLVLHAATRVSTVPGTGEKDIAEALNMRAKDFNNDPRRDPDLPKLKNDPRNKPYVPVTIAKFNNIYRLSEK